jgi:diguanylate cyclase
MLYIAVDREMAAKLTALTMATLDKLQLPALPTSYSVMFAYHAGQSSDLVREVEALLAEPAAATLSRCEQIYDRYFGAEPMLLDYNEAITGLGRGVEKIGGLLADVADHAVRFSEIGHDLQAAREACSGPVQTKLDHAASRLAALARENERLRAAIAEQVAASTMSIARARERFEAEQAASRTDPLTRIGNRRRLDEEMARHQDAALILADLDHFKRFNDSYGHKAGDLILVAFARILRQVAGERGLAARFGGEEFAVFLPNCPLDEAVRVADRARAMLEGMVEITIRNQMALSKVTASFGVAAGGGADKADILVERADKALYQAKNGGRNRVMAG